MAATSSSFSGSDPGGDQSSSSSSSGPSSTSGSFECNICLDMARDAVVSLCGHLFCWPCLHQWIEIRPNATCPVCKSAISRDKVIPLYGRDTQDQKDPRDKIPPRPPGQRSEPESQRSFPGFQFGQGGGFQMSFGIAGFPFGVFSSLNINPTNSRPAASNQAQPAGHEQFMSQIFLIIAVFFIFWILIT